MDTHTESRPLVTQTLHEANFIRRFERAHVDHPAISWMLWLIVSLGASCWVGEVLRERIEQERISILMLDAQRRASELSSNTLNGHQMGALGLLGLIEGSIKDVATKPHLANGKEAVALMESIGRMHGADGVYVVGQDGIIKSSWGVGQASAGVDVKFRPYAQMALRGKENIYAGIGKTSGLRNLYYAAPLYAGNQIDTPVIGAVVMRTGVSRLDKLVAEKSDIGLLLSPQGVVFSASRSEWVGMVAGKLDAERVREIRQLRQLGDLFDDKTPQALPLSIEPGIASLNGVAFAVVQARLAWNDPYGEWMLVLMEDLSRTVPIRRVAQAYLITAVIMLLIGWGLSLLLRGHYREVSAAGKLAAYASIQRAAAERKAEIAVTAFRLQQETTLNSLVPVLFAERHRVLGGLQGVLYLHSPVVANRLTLGGTYACTDQPPESLEMGEGLLGQCAIEREMRVFPVQPDGFGMIRSGLGEARPAALMIAPILLNNNLLGVLEVALLEVPGDVAREQFQEIIAHLAINLEILGRARAMDHEDRHEAAPIELDEGAKA